MSEGRIFGSNEMTQDWWSRRISASSAEPPGSAIRLIDPKWSAFTSAGKAGRSASVSIRPAECSSKKAYSALPSMRVTKASVVGRSLTLAKDTSTRLFSSAWRSIFPKKSVDRPPNQAERVPSRPIATATLNTDPPAKGWNTSAPSTPLRGSMSINASPQLTIIGALPAPGVWPTSKAVAGHLSQKERWRPRHSAHSRQPGNATQSFSSCRRLPPAPALRQRQAFLPVLDRTVGGDRAEARRGGGVGERQRIGQRPFLVHAEEDAGGEGVPGAVAPGNLLARDAHRRLQLDRAVARRGDAAVREVDDDQFRCALAEDRDRRAAAAFPVGGAVLAERRDAADRARLVIVDDDIVEMRQARARQFRDPRRRQRGHLDAGPETRRVRLAEHRHPAERVALPRRVEHLHRAGNAEMRD